MVRSALGTRFHDLQSGPRRGFEFIPPASVLAGSMLALLPIVSETGWIPDFGFIMLVAWRLLRSDVWPSWWAAPLGFANDLVSGAPIGLSVALWTAAMLALDLTDRRTMWRDYWIEWLLAVLLITASELAHWRIAALMGAPLEPSSVGPRVLIASFCFPLGAWAVATLDRWRLGR